MKAPDRVVFVDREPRLKVKPDVLGDFRFLPFRSGSFGFAVFDPPHIVRKKEGPGFYKWAHSDPAEDSRKMPYVGQWWGFFESTREMLTSIDRAERELHRVVRYDGMLYFKWNDNRFSFNLFLPKFRTRWLELIRTARRSLSGRRSRSQTYWILFRRREA